MKLRPLKLSAAIATIIAGALMIVTCVLEFISLDDADKAFSSSAWMQEAGHGLNIATSEHCLVVVIAISIAVIVFGAICFRKKRHKFFTLLTLIAVSVMFINYILCTQLIESLYIFRYESEEPSVLFEIFAMVTSAIAIALTSIYLGNIGKVHDSKKAQPAEVSGCALKIKRAAAILTIIVSAYFIFDSIASIYVLSGDSNLVPNDSDVRYIFPLILLFVAYGAAVLLNGILFCGKKSNKSVGITLMVLTSILTFFILIAAIGNGGSSLFIYLILLTCCLAIIILTSIYFALNKITNPNTAFNKKREVYKQLKEEGTLTDKEYKELVLKDLDKL